MQVRWTTAAASPTDSLSTQLLNGSISSALPKEEERFLSAQADAFAGANAEEKASACSVRNDESWGSERGRERAKARPYKEQALHASGAAGAYERCTLDQALFQSGQL